MNEAGGTVDSDIQVALAALAIAGTQLGQVLHVHVHEAEVIIFEGSCRVPGWWVWVARSEGIWCDSWSASSQPARARSFCHHGCTGPGQPLGAAGRRQVLRLRAPTPLARGRALPRLQQRCGDPGRVRRHATVPATLSV